MYDDIINTRYPFTLKHSRMSDYARCSQFMPFSALSGYSEAVKEMARITENKVIIDEELKEVLDNKLNKIRKVLFSKPIVSITYFVPDLNKDGGSYECYTGVVNKIDLYKNEIIMENKMIPIDDILDITSDIFSVTE